MKKKKAVLKKAGEVQYNDKHGVLKEIIDEPVESRPKTLGSGSCPE